MDGTLWLHGVLPDRPVSVRVSPTTFRQFERLQENLGKTGDQVLKLADDLNIEAFEDDTSLSGAFQALESWFRGKGHHYGR